MALIKLGGTPKVIYCSVLIMSLFITPCTGPFTYSQEESEISEKEVSYPIHISWERVVTEPKEVTELPNIRYEKKENIQLNEAAWMVKIDGTMHGMWTTVEIRGAERMPIRKESGTITAEDGNWQNFVTLVLSQARASGKGSIQLALYDPDRFNLKGKKKKERQISNRLLAPIKISGKK